MIGVDIIEPDTLPLHAVDVKHADIVADGLRASILATSISGAPMSMPCPARARAASPQTDGKCLRRTKCVWHPPDLRPETRTRHRDDFARSSMAASNAEGLPRPRCSFVLPGFHMAFRHFSVAAGVVFAMTPG